MLAWDRTAASMVRGARHRIVLWFAVPVLCLACVAPAGAAVRHRGPYLKVTRLIVERLGRNPYLVVPTSGALPKVRVKVRTTNVGHATSSPSYTWVFLRGRGGHFVAVPDVIHVPSLAPGRSFTKTAKLTGVAPKLGLDHVAAYADCNLDRTRTSCNGPRNSPPIPVIARTWDVRTLKADLGQVQQQFDQNEHAAMGFYFRFKRFDVRTGRFYYSASGRLVETATVYPNVNGCSGTGADSVGHAPWPMSSNFWINFGLNRYQAYVFASNQAPFPVQITCTSFPPSTQDFGFLDVQAPPRPSVLWPYSTQIAGHATVNQGLNVVDYEWHLVADVP